MDATETKTVFGRLAKAVRAKSLRRGKSTSSQELDVTAARIDSGLTDLTKTETVGSQKSEKKIDVGRNCAIFKDASKATASGSQSTAQTARVQEQSRTDARLKTIGDGVVRDAETEYFDFSMEPTTAATEFANDVIEEAFERDPTVTVEDVADVTTVTEIMKTVVTKPNNQSSKPPVEIQIEKVETKLHFATKRDIKDFAKTVLAGKTVKKEATKGTANTTSKKEEKTVLGPIRAQWQLKLKPKNSNGRIRKPVNVHINLHHKGDMPPGNRAVGSADKYGGSSRPPPNLNPGRRS
jgi:hypothetical protein